MKKIYLLFTMMLCILLCSCGSIDENVEKKADGTEITEDNNEAKDYKLTVKAFIPLCDCPDQISLDSEIEIWKEKNAGGIKEPDAQKELAVLLFDKVYTGSYDKSFCRYWSYENYLRREYKTSVGTFAVKSTDGKLIYYSGKKIKLFDHEISENEAIAKFNEIADEYIKNKEEYEFIIDKVANLDEDDYYMIYSRPLNGIKTSESFTMGFSSDGNVTGLSSVMVDEFTEFYETHSKEEINMMTEKLTSDEATKKLEERLVSILGEYNEYVIINKTYTILEDGSLALVCEVGVDPVYDEPGKYANNLYGLGINTFEKGTAIMTICFDNGYSFIMNEKTENLSEEFKKNSQEADKIANHFHDSLYGKYGRSKKDNVYTVDGLEADNFPEYYAGKFINTDGKLVIQIKEDYYSEDYRNSDWYKELIDLTGSEEFACHPVKYSYGELIQAIDSICFGEKNKELKNAVIEPWTAGINDYSNCIDVSVTPKNYEKAKEILDSDIYNIHSEDFVFVDD